MTDTATPATAVRCAPAPDFTKPRSPADSAAQALTMQGVDVRRDDDGHWWAMTVTGGKVCFGDAGDGGVAIGGIDRIEPGSVWSADASSVADAVRIVRRAVRSLPRQSPCEWFRTVGAS